MCGNRSFGHAQVGDCKRNAVLHRTRVAKIQQCDHKANDCNENIAKDDSIRCKGKRDAHVEPQHNQNHDPSVGHNELDHDKSQDHRHDGHNGGNRQHDFRVIARQQLTRVVFGVRHCLDAPHDHQHENRTDI